MATYIRGVAYLRMHGCREAVTEFRKVTEHPGGSWEASGGILFEDSFTRFRGWARRGGYAMSGDSGQARMAYGKFFEVGRMRMLDSPLLREAKAEYLRLK